MRDHTLWALTVIFVGFSLSSFGGGPSLFAPIQHQAVDVEHWLNNREFIDLFAISRAAPGPGTMLVTLIGWHVSGWAGAVIATLALFLPSSLLCYGVAHVWNRYRGHELHTALEAGLAPVGTGLILAGILTIGQTAGGGLLLWLTAGVTALLLARTKLHPIVLLAGGALLFIAAGRLQQW